MKSGGGDRPAAARPAADATPAGADAETLRALRLALLRLLGDERAARAAGAEPVVLVAPAPYVTVALASAITGFTDKAIRRKIEDGVWVEGQLWKRAPDGHILINLEGYRRWVDQAPAVNRPKR